MGALRGDTSLFSVADLLQHLSGLQKSGTLAITLGDNQKIIFLSPEGMRLVRTSNPRTSSLGEILIRTRKITRAELDQLLEQQKQTGKRLGELVARLGKVSKQDIQNALREQVEEEIYDLFVWTDAKFEFEECPPPPVNPDNPWSDIVLDSSPMGVMLEASRRADEMQMVMKAIRDESLVPFKTTRVFTPMNLGLSPDLLSAVYREINGRASVAEVVRKSLYPRFDALRAMYVLITKGFAKVVDREGATVMVLEHETKRRTAPAAAARKSSAPAPAASTGKSLLLLGDMIKYRSALALILRNAGYGVIEEVASGMTGLLAAKAKIDAVILDVSLNIDDGLTFCAWIRDNLGVPIMVLSADASREAGQRALECGAKAYVVKPFTSEVVLRTVSNVLAPLPAQAAN